MKTEAGSIERFRTFELDCNCKLDFTAMDTWWIKDYWKINERGRGGEEEGVAAALVVVMMLRELHAQCSPVWRFRLDKVTPCRLPAFSRAPGATEYGRVLLRSRSADCPVDSHVQYRSAAPNRRIEWNNVDCERLWRYHLRYWSWLEK